MKTEVLIWRARHGGSAQQMLDSWLAENKDKEIVIVSQSEGGTVIADYRITYTIFYKETK